MKRFILVLLMCLLAFPVHAVLISPIPVVVKPGQKVVVFTIGTVTDEEKEKIFEAKVYRWNVETDELIPAPEVVVYPLTLKAPVNFKIAFKKKPDTSQKEATYRIVVNEIPVQEKEESGIQIVMSYSVPVFVKPVKIIESFDVSSIEDGFIVKNTGNVTLKIEKVNDEPVVMYIGPGSEKVIKAKTITIKEKQFKSKNIKEV